MSRIMKSKIMRPALQLIEGGRASDREWTDADIRRLSMPSIKALPFVKVKKDAEPQWHPESYWHVAQSRDWAQSHERGRQYAIAAVAAMREDGRNVLGGILRDMVRAGVDREITARKEKRRHPRRDVVMIGFLNQLGKMIEFSCGLAAITEQSG